MKRKPSETMLRLEILAHVRIEHKTILYSVPGYWLWHRILDLQAMEPTKLGLGRLGGKKNRCACACQA